MDSISTEHPNFSSFFWIDNKSNIIKKKKERRIQVFTMVNNEKTTESKETEKSRDYSKRRNELYNRRTIQDAPTPRPIKESLLAQILQLTQ